MRVLNLSSLLPVLCLASFSTFAVNAPSEGDISKKEMSSPRINDTFVNDTILPPQIQWHGASESLLLDKNAPWSTPFEQSNYINSPNYHDTFVWLDKLVAQSNLIHKVSLGKSPQGRDIWMFVASSKGAKTPNELKQNHKPSILVQAGIHAGEIDGKDAGMMLLRDIVLGEKRSLLDDVNLLFVPIFNVDGHERHGKYNRVNQRGPVDMGWRTNANNLNLNRDYAKADTAEMQLMLSAINTWDPQLYIDVHVTDGIDYQYDVTFGYNLSNGLSPNSYQWLENKYRPQIETALTAAGHIPGPLVFAIDNTDLTKGLTLWNASPRFSNGYGDARHLPTILIENHSLKPYKQRVLGTYVLLEQTLKTLSQHGTLLKMAISKDKFAFNDRVTLTWEAEQQPQGWDFKGIGYSTEQSPISGNSVVRWSGEPKLYQQLPVVGRTKAKLKINRPSAYYLLPQWTEVIERLSIHGIRMTQLQKPTRKIVQQYQFSDPTFDKQSYEGHQRVSVQSSLSPLELTLPTGTVKIETDQPLGDLAILLLEPQSTDSFLQWGFFNPIFTRTEYIEDYAVEPLAQKMLQDNPSLQAEFDAALKDEVFASDAKARLRWFYQRSAYYDDQYLKYPVYREQ
ncbi:carboxypeptidase [Parashewanella spongiae]|uniref:Carboxypeptidase n=1 Tax=Parashewanella spongiae TaxID=342950 RepID=A0A3A6T6M4_9GAMM|nr:M14 family metallopeptidase [Parashewanella spongiae]MCL1079830.1 M14 family metallopeptidase [Parashewanella spongiae]RJY06825.1 carboxypeptidase [Parashewanella spongiae]